MKKRALRQLKISDIAAKSSISPSSIYQYFSDKESIILALAMQYMEVIHDIIEENLAEIHTLAQLPDLLEKNFQDIYQLHCEEPALREIWFESIDPKLNKLAYEDTARNIKTISEKLVALTGESNREELTRYVTLCSHQFSAVMRLCFAVDEAEARKLIAIQTRMVIKALPEFIHA